jgi:hypothetical protein
LNVHKAAVLLSLLMREDAHAPAEQHGPLPEPMPLLELAVAAVTGAHAFLSCTAAPRCVGPALIVYRLPLSYI